MSEYIDREVAREYLHNACESIGGNGGMMLKLKFDVEPPADVRPNVHGEWVEITNHEFEDIQVSEAMCTNCNLYSSQMLAYGNISYKYCPRCGAKIGKE